MKKNTCCSCLPPSVPAIAHHAHLTVRPRESNLAEKRYTVRVTTEG
jgi:hypothetical protein